MDQSDENSKYKGFCYCGKVHYSVNKNTQPHSSCYCHCESCRRAHSAPLYQVVYVPKADFHITQGVEFISRFCKDGSTVTRAFCRECGSRIYNTLARDDDWWGFFPATLEESIQHNLPSQFLPSTHNLAEETVLSEINEICVYAKK